MKPHVLYLPEFEADLKRGTIEVLAQTRGGPTRVRMHGYEYTVTINAKQLTAVLTPAPRAKEQQ